MKTFEPANYGKFVAFYYKPHWIQYGQLVSKIRAVEELQKQ